MKKIALLTAALVMTSSMVYAGIQNSAHDLSGIYPKVGGANQGSTEICVYCHTPHNAIKDVPLWNRNNPSNGNFTLYNSPTLTTAAQGSRFYDDSVSLFCMSCHDGVTKLGAFVNNPNTTSGGDQVRTAAQATGTNLTNYAALGTNLKNDHPVGFSYASAQSEDSQSGTGGLNAIATVKTKFNITATNYAPFYKANAGAVTDTMECASCHKVHEPGASGNFLRVENTGSALCLACHNK